MSSHGGDPAKIALAAAKMKKTLENNINRVDLLTDGKIHDMKALMKDLAEQILKLNKRITITENEAIKKEYDQIPADILALTKDELELRQDLAHMIAQARESRDNMLIEYKRLRREHYGNLKDIEQILVSFDQLSAKVKSANDQ